VSEYRVGDRRQSDLYLTQDAGSHWRHVKLPGAPIYTHFFDRERGLTVTMPGADGRTSSVLRTTADGGRHWQASPMPNQPMASFPQVFFSGPDDGWQIRVGSRNERLALYRTVNAGSSWVRTTLPHDLPLPLSARMTFWDSLHGLVFVHPENRALRTETTADAGSHWQESTLPDLPVRGRATVLPTSSRLFAGGAAMFSVRVSGGRLEDPYDYVYISSDGGASWAQPMPLPRPDSHEPISSFVSYLDPLHW
jgi:photosystem II stability/assembly factor-like uncharacterized protein